MACVIRYLTMTVKLRPLQLQLREDESKEMITLPLCHR